jgi:hypothetical protein
MGPGEGRGFREDAASGIHRRDYRPPKQNSDDFVRGLKEYHSIPLDVAQGSGNSVIPSRTRAVHGGRASGKTLRRESTGTRSGTSEIPYIDMCGPIVLRHRGRWTTTSTAATTRTIACGKRRGTDDGRMRRRGVGGTTSMERAAGWETKLRLRCKWDGAKMDRFRALDRAACRRFSRREASDLSTSRSSMA